MLNPKEQYMNGNNIAVTGQKKETIEAWRRERELTNCQTCNEPSCGARNDSTRFNCDAGGQLQCIRLAKHISPYAFLNADGRVIIIPDEVRKALQKRV